MKTLGADIVAAREDSRQLLSQAEKQGNESDMALKDQFTREEQLAKLKAQCKHAMGEARGEEQNRDELNSRTKQL